MLEIRRPTANVIGKLFVVFLIVLLAFQHRLLKKHVSISGLWDFDETIKICLDAFYDDSDLQALIPRDVFVELMKSATSSVEFSFNNTMYKQTRRSSYGITTWSGLANIFVGYYEEKFIFSNAEASNILQIC